MKEGAYANKKVLRIVMLTTVRFNRSKGGIEKVMINMANEMSDRGHQVTIVYRDGNGDEPGFPLKDKVKKVNCAAVKTPILLRGFARNLRSLSFTAEEFHRKNAYLKLKAMASRFKNAIERIEADVYITYEPKITCMLLHEFKTTKPIVTTIHFSPNHLKHRVDSKWLLPLIAGKGVVQVLQKEYIDELKQMMPSSDFVVIPNAVDVPEMCSTLKRPLIVSIGRVVGLKNQILIEKAFCLLKDKYPEWNVEIWGEKTIERATTEILEKEVAANGLTQRLVLKGPTNVVQDKLLNASIFAFPSKHEAFPLSLLEAMAAGVPCIGLKNCPGVNSIISHGVNGLLSEDTPESFAECLELLMRDEELRIRLGKEARNSVKQYKPEVIWKRWEDLLYGLVGH